MNFRFMTPEQERKKFRASFDDEDWQRLESNAEFKSAWDAGNIVKAGEIAPIVLYGPTRSKKEARTARVADYIIKNYR